VPDAAATENLKTERSNIMPIVAIKVELPPKGELETKGGGESPTDEQMQEESRIRQDYIDSITPTIEAAIKSSPHRSGNVTRVELLGTDVWSQMNPYLVLVSVDIGDPRLDVNALAPGGTATVVGSYASLGAWPEKDEPAD
jgi:hypothetical protein